MKKKLLSVLLVICIAVTLIPGVFAVEDISGKYLAVSCSQGSSTYSCDDEYVIINADGTGAIFFSGSEYNMTWTLDGENLSFVDTDGYGFEGTVKDGVIKGTYDDYDYKYVLEGTATTVASSSATFVATSCFIEDKNYDCDGEYVILNDDGTGTVVYNNESYTLNWSVAEDGSFSAVDNMGNTMKGTLQGTILTVEFHGYNYIFENNGTSAGSQQLSDGTWGEGLPYVVDQAGILEDSEFAELTSFAEEVSNKHMCNVYIIVVDDFTKYTSGSIETYAEEIRTGYNLGYGSEHNTIMLLLSMNNRKYDICAFGNLGNTAFTDYGKDYIAGNFKDDFSDDNWYQGLHDFVFYCDELLTMNENGEPMDVTYPGDLPVVKFIGSFILAVIISAIFCEAKKRKMKNVDFADEAGEYIPKNGVNITRRRDQFTHTTRDRVYDPPSKSSGGGTSVGGSGHSHSSGSF